MKRIFDPLEQAAQANAVDSNKLVEELRALEENSNHS